MEISEAGMKYWEQLMDIGDETISDGEEYFLREAFDWVDQNENAIDFNGLAIQRRKWLTSAESEVFSGKYAAKSIVRDLKGFSDALIELAAKNMITV